MNTGIGIVIPPWGRTGTSLRAEVRAYALFNDQLTSDGDNAYDLRFNLGLMFGGIGRATPPARAPGAGDSDGDGVGDASDACPGTARGRAVDGRGCVVVEKVVLSGVGFGTGSATLKASARRELDDVVEALKARRNLHLEVAGHTDATGPENANLALSRRRAEAVRQYLIDHGIASYRLTARGYGESQPIDTNDTPQGRARNRRVEFRAIDD